MAKPFHDCVLLLGDSLTSGQAVPQSLNARFSEMYQRSFDILNRGLAGYNSTWYLPLIDHIMARKEDINTYPRIRLFTIWLGTNDASLGEPQNAHIPLFKANITDILDSLTSPASPYAVTHSDLPLTIILITPPPVEQSMMPNPQDVSNDSTIKYRDAIREIGEQWKSKRNEGDNWKLGVVDLYSALVEEGRSEGMPRLFTGGIHLSTAGYDILWAEIDRMVDTEFRGRGIDWNDQADLPWTAPVWSEPAQHGTQRDLELLRSSSHKAGDGP